MRIFLPSHLTLNHLIVVVIIHSTVNRITSSPTHTSPSYAPMFIDTETSLS